jgi:hypothetical protein
VWEVRIRDVEVALKDCRELAGAVETGRNAIIAPGPALPATSTNGRELPAAVEAESDAESRQTESQPSPGTDAGSGKRGSGLSKQELDKLVKGALDERAGFNVEAPTWRARYHASIRAIRIEKVIEIVKKVAGIPHLAKSSARTPSWVRFHNRRLREGLGPVLGGAARGRPDSVLATMLSATPDPDSDESDSSRSCDETTEMEEFLKRLSPEERANLRALTKAEQIEWLRQYQITKRDAEEAERPVRRSRNRERE